MRTILLAAALAAFSLSAAPVAAEKYDPLNDPGRTVLLDVELEQATDTHTFDVPAEFNPRFHYFSMFVGDPGTDEPPQLWINGRHRTTLPIPRSNGDLIYGLPGGDLIAGEENEVRFTAPDGSAVEVARVKVFELYGGAEAAHADQIFGELPEDGRRWTTPPVFHPSRPNFDVQHYDLELDLDINSRDISGVMTMEAVSLVDGLEQVGLDFVTGTQGGNTMTVTGVDMVPSVGGLSFTTDTSNHWLNINIPSGSRPDTNDTFTIVVEYSGTPHTTPTGVFNRGAYQRTLQPSPNNTPVLHTISEAYVSKIWWPNKDDMSDKATIDLRISVQDPYQVVSNGVLMTTTGDGPGRTRYHWSHNHPVATYLVAFVAADFLSDSITYTALDGVTEMDITHWVYQTSPEELDALPDTLDVMEHFADLFGEYPFLDEKYGTMTWGITFGMEHQTITSLPDGELSAGGVGFGKSRRNVHELAHMWFGDMVGIPNFDHLWLKEGWATLCEALYEEYDLGEAAYFSRIQAFISSGLNDNTPMVNSGAGNSFANSLYYRKGAVVLHMLRGVMGDEDFFAGTRDYLQTYAYGIADTDDFREIMEDHYGGSLEWFFDRWVYGTGRPAYTWGWTQSGSTLELVVNQIQPGVAFQMPIPFVVTFTDSTTETFRPMNTAKNETLNVDVGSRTVLSVDFDPLGWIYRGSDTQLNATPDPTIRIVRQGSDANSVEVTWQSGGGSTTNFEVMTSPDRSTWTVAETLPSSQTSTTLTGVAQGTLLNVAVRATGGGTPSPLSNVYAVRTSPDPSQDRVLIVEGYERWNSQSGRTRNHPWAAVHGDSVDAYGVPFDTVSNQMVISGAAVLGDYDALVWNLGEESTVHHTFDSTERTLVRNYLDAGGKLFVSGAEIGWDLGRAASPNTDFDFYNNYLKADFGLDDAGSYVVNGVADSVFDGLTDIPYDDGSAGIYFQNWPDEIDPFPGSGSTAALLYANGRGAAVQFEGLFPNGTAPGHLVYLGFAFETIHDGNGSRRTDPSANRDAIMSTSLSFFGLTPEVETGVDAFMLY